MSRDERRKDLERQVEAIRAHYVEYDLLTEIKDDMRRLHERDNSASEGGCMAIFGPSGSGKTKLIRDYESGFVREKRAIVKSNGDYADRLPVVVVKVPDTSLKSLTELMYQTMMGEPPPDGRRFDIQGAILEFATEMEVKLFIFDEAHQSVDDKTDKAARAVSVFLKDLSNEGKFSIVIVGTESARRILDGNAELARRTLVTHELTPFDWDTKDGRETFLSLLAEFDNELKPVFGRLSGFTQPELAVRIHAASHGLVGEMAKLIENAGVKAVADVVRGKADRITIEHFARALERGSHRKGGPNPFRMAEVEPWRPLPVTPVVPSREGGRTRRTRRSNEDANFRP